MAKIVAAITMSVDGYITGPDDGPGKGLGDGGERLHYVGTHPCFLSPTVERRAGEPHLLHPGYRRHGWWHDAPGFRFGGNGLRGRVGVNHLPLADFLNTILDTGLRLDHIEEPGEDDYAQAPISAGRPALTGRRRALWPCPTDGDD